MKLLLDANLSWRLTSVLTEHFGECIHAKIILLRVGNMNRKMAEQIILQAKSSILDLETSDCGLLEIV